MIKYGTIKHLSALTIAIFLAPGVSNAVEYLNLPDYPPAAITTIGKMQTHKVSEEDTLLDIARAYDLGFVEMRAANPKTDPWAPLPDSKVKIPTLHILPRAPQDGVVINLGEMRLYHFQEAGKPPVSFPIGVGREGMNTPLGQTTVTQKSSRPSWYPTPRMRKENPDLPKVIPPGESNPLGTRALYLGWPTFLIHGTNKPWGIGRQVSSGCIRLYPEDIKSLYRSVPKGTKVTVVDQPIKIAWIEGALYLEAHPSRNQANEIELQGGRPKFEMPEGLIREILETAGAQTDQINWEAVRTTIKARNGYPIQISK